MDNYMKKNFTINVLRRGSYRWPSRFNALKAGKIGRNEYFCAICGVIGGKKDVQLDHVIPCVPVTGWDSFDGFIDRMFPDDPSGFQVLCKPCHKEKSLAENVERAKHRK